MKEGSRVVCINNLDNKKELSIGGIYIIKSKSLISKNYGKNQSGFCIGLKLFNDISTYKTYKSDRFMSLEEYRNLVINEILLNK